MKAPEQRGVGGDPSLNWIGKRCLLCTAALPALRIRDCADCRALCAPAPLAPPYTDEATAKRSLVNNAHHFLNAYYHIPSEGMWFFEQGLLWAAYIAQQKPALLQRIAADGSLLLTTPAYINEWLDIQGDALDG